MAAPPSSAHRSGSDPAAEVNAIRRELASMQNDVRRDLEMESTTNALAAEIQTLYHELQNVAAKLEAERSLRRRIEAELEEVRESRQKETADVIQQLEDRRTELQKLREERATLKEWLDRGASECRRVADEVLKLRGDVEQSETSCKTLSEEKRQLSHRVEELTRDLQEAHARVEQLHHERSVMELRINDTIEAVKVAEETRKSAMSDVQRLESEVARLHHRVRGANDSVYALASLCGTIAQLTDNVHVLERSLATHGALPSAQEPNQPALIFQSVPPRDQVDMASLDPEKQAQEAKRLLNVMLQSMRSLESSVRRFMADRQRASQDEQRAHQDELAALHRAKEMQLVRYNSERGALEQKIGTLERELVAVAGGVSDLTSEEAMKRLQQLEHLIEQNRALNHSNEELRKENESLVLRAKKSKIDWAKVDESRRRLQQLQMEVQLMQEYHEKVSAENRNLKMMLNISAKSGGAAAAAATDGISGSPQRRADQLAFEAWKKQLSS